MEKQIELALEETARDVHDPQTLTSMTYHGDAFDLFRLQRESSIDLVISSPPYWGHRDYGLDHNWEYFNDIPTVRDIGSVSPGYEWYRKSGGLLGLEPYPEWFVAHLAEILDEARRCLKPGGSMWINVGDTYFARWASIRESGRQGLGTDERYRRKTPLGGIRQEKQLLLIPARFAIAMQERAWILRNDLIWHKPNAVPRPEGDRLRNTHEHFFHFVKKPSSGRAAYYYDIDSVEQRAGDVVAVNVVPGEGGHSATFPHDLIEPRIRSSSPPGGTVLDPFCGTGRALEVAKALGRHVIGFDAQKKFIDLTESKLHGNQSARRRQFRQ
jgi:DNA modification methylase